MIGDNDTNINQLVCLSSYLPVEAEHLDTGCNRLEPVTPNHKGEVSDLNYER